METNITPDMVKEARQRSGLTQTEAAELVGRTMRGWQNWERGKRTIDEAVFELFLSKTGIARPDGQVQIAFALTEEQARALAAFVREVKTGGDLAGAIAALSAALMELGFDPGAGG